jgi:uncharacterized protein YjiK
MAGALFDIKLLKMRILIQKGCPALFFLVFVCTLMVQTGCKQSSHGSPQGYDLRKPEKRDLGKVLNEISGLSYDDDSNFLLAISDSKRKIFQINLKNRKLKDYAEKFAEQADFEDLVKIGDTVYALISDGTIIAIPRGTRDNNNTTVYKFWSKENNDFETLYHDPELNSLVILCKSCEMEKGQGVRTAFRFDLAGRRFDSTVLYQINTDSVKAAVKTNDASFKPSAAAIHPIDKRLYILASSGNLLVITDTRGKVMEVYNLNPDRHPQAEGITFAPNGTMFISNEGKYGKATIQIYQYRKPVAGSKKPKN